MTGPYFKYKSTKNKEKYNIYAHEINKYSEVDAEVIGCGILTCMAIVTPLILLRNNAVPV
jgi:hypothetical protein